MSAIEILKLQLDDFFERSKTQNIAKTINKEQLYFNQSLFELEKHLFDLKVRYQVNQNLNTSIISTNIIDSFSLRSTFFRINDYALSFLVFLTMEEKHDAEDLLEMIDKYLDVIKNKLTFHDIVKTKTGATRCYTNIRFTLSELRKFGLVYNSTTIKNNYSRSTLPTPFGYLISLFVNTPKEFEVIKHLPNTGNSSNSFVPPLYLALSSIRNHPDDFLAKILNKYEGIRPLEKVLKMILDDYCNCVLKFIELTDKGLKVEEKELEKSIKTYYH